MNYYQKQIPLKVIIMQMVILIYLVRFYDVLEIDLFDAALKKIKINQLKYPAQLVKGSAKKYTELNDSGEKYPI